MNSGISAPDCVDITFEVADVDRVKANLSWSVSQPVKLNVMNNLQS